MYAKGAMMMTMNEYRQGAMKTQENTTGFYFSFQPHFLTPHEHIILAINIIVYLCILILLLDPTSIEFNIIHQSLLSALVNSLSLSIFTRHQPSFYITEYNVAKQFKFVYPIPHPPRPQRRYYAWRSGRSPLISRMFLSVYIRCILLNTGCSRKRKIYLLCCNKIVIY